MVPPIRGTRRMVSRLAEPRIEGEGLRPADADAFEVWVQRVQQVVQVVGNDRGWHCQHRGFAGCGPAVAKIGESLRPRKVSPPTWEIRDSNERDLHRIRNLRRNADVVLCEVVVVQVHQELQDRKRKRGGRVDDRGSAMVPPAAEESGALAVEGRGAPLGETPDPGQLYTPCSIRPRIVTTSSAPRSVSSRSSGAIPPSARFSFWSHRPALSRAPNTSRRAAAPRAGRSSRSDSSARRRRSFFRRAKVRAGRPTTRASVSSGMPKWAPTAASEANGRPERARSMTAA